MRKYETLDRHTWEACIADLDGDTQESLRAELESWDGGDTCERIDVTTDSLGRIDSESSPSPA